MEDDPFITIEVNGEEVRGDRHSLSLFTYIGEVADHNHVFLSLDEDETSFTGAHIWHDHHVYQQLCSFIVENGLPMHLNLNDVAECDQDAREHYIRNMLGDLTDENLDQLLADAQDEPPEANK